MAIRILTKKPLKLMTVNKKATATKIFFSVALPVDAFRFNEEVFKCFLHCVEDNVEVMSAGVSEPDCVKCVIDSTVEVNLRVSGQCVSQPVVSVSNLGS